MRIGILYPEKRSVPAETIISWAKDLKGDLENDCNPIPDYNPDIWEAIEYLEEYDDITFVKDYVV